MLLVPGKFRRGLVNPGLVRAIWAALRNQPSPHWLMADNRPNSLKDSSHAGWAGWVRLSFW